MRLCSIHNKILFNEVAFKLVGYSFQDLSVMFGKNGF